MGRATYFPGNDTPARRGNGDEAMLRCRCEYAPAVLTRPARTRSIAGLQCGGLADRLMAALVVGDRADGDYHGRLAAGIRIAKPDVEPYWLEQYVDRSDDAVNDLAGNMPNWSTQPSQLGQQKNDG